MTNPDLEAAAKALRAIMLADPVRQEVIGLLGFIVQARWDDCDDTAYIDRKATELLARLKAQTDN